MKNRFKVLIASLLGFVSISFYGCSGVHIHNYEWKNDEDTHWQECTKCGERLNVTDHKMDSLTDTCIICGYKDQVVIKDEKGILTSLTKYAKSKVTITIPDDITYIGNNSFNGANCKDIYASKSLLGVCENAFDGSPMKDNWKDHIHTGESDIEWILIDGIYYKYDKKEEKEAMIDGVFYKTLEEAINAVKEDNTTITLLKENPTITPNKPIEIIHNINLETDTKITKCVLKLCNFNIRPSGSLRITNNIEYQGETRLLLGEIKERLGDANKEQDAYSSGSLVFLNTDKIPDDPKYSVYYVKDFEKEGVKAIGSLQSESLLSSSFDCYAFGVFNLSKTLDEIVGLTKFGSSLHGLNVVKPYESESKFNIVDWAFTVPTEIRIKIPIKDIKIKLYKQKGNYRNLTIGDGIYQIGYRAFSNWYDSSQVPSELVEELAPILAPLTTLTIGSTVGEIKDQAFYYCSGLKNVIISSEEGRSRLFYIGKEAFKECMNLNTFDLKKSDLRVIDSNCFKGCKNLKNISLPYNNGWTAGGFGYLPEVMNDSTLAAYLISTEHPDKKWERNLLTKVCYYNPNEKDSKGRFNKVNYANSFEDAYNNCKDGYIICLCDESARQDPIESVTINKNIKVVGSTLYKNTTFKNITIQPNKYLIIDENLVNDDTKFVLKCNGKNHEYKDVSGVAISASLNGENKKFNVLYNNGDGTTVAGQYVSKLNDENSYYTYGLFNFKVDMNQNVAETINSLSSLGKIAKEFEVSSQLGNNVKVNLAWNPFEKSSVGVRKIIFGNGIDTIGRHVIGTNTQNNLEEAVFKSVHNFEYRAFVDMKKLKSVDFSEDKFLETIGESAFQNCSSLNRIALADTCNIKKIGKNAFKSTYLIEFDLGANNKNGWKAGSHEFSVEELTPSNTAKYLTYEYVSNEWTRNV